MKDSTKAPCPAYVSSRLAAGFRDLSLSPVAPSAGSSGVLACQAVVGKGMSRTGPVLSFSVLRGGSSSHSRTLSVGLRCVLLGDVCVTPVFVWVFGGCFWLSLAEGRHVCVSPVSPHFNSLHFRAMCCRLAASCCGFIAVTSLPISSGWTSSNAPRKISAIVSSSVNSLRHSLDTYALSITGGLYLGLGASPSGSRWLGSTVPGSFLMAVGPH